MPIMEIITGIATLGAGLLQAKNTADINNKMLSIQEQENRTTEDQFNRNEALRREEMKQSREQSIWGKRLQERSLDMQQNEVDRSRIDKAAQRYADFLNSKTALTANRMAGFQR